MIDNQIRRANRIDAIWIAAELQHGIAHSRKIHHRRDAGEILQNYARRLKRDLDLGIAFRALRVAPFQDLAHVLLEHVEVVAIAHGRLEQDTNGKGQAI